MQPVYPSIFCNFFSTPQDNLPAVPSAECTRWLQSLKLCPKSWRMCRTFLQLVSIICWLYIVLTAVILPTNFLQHRRPATQPLERRVRIPKDTHALADSNSRCTPAASGCVEPQRMRRCVVAATTKPFVDAPTRTLVGQSITAAHGGSEEFLGAVSFVELPKFA